MTIFKCGFFLLCLSAKQTGESLGPLWWRDFYCYVNENTHGVYFYKTLLDLCTGQKRKKRDTKDGQKGNKKEKQLRNWRIKE